MPNTTNSTTKLFINIKPEEQTPVWEEVLNMTQVLFNKNPKTADREYFQNAGNTTSQITGMAQSLSIELDLDSTIPAHRYLTDLLLDNDFSKWNGQQIRIELPTLPDETTPASVAGTSCLVFKNGIPSGIASDLIKLSFDILPQERPWVFTPSVKKTQ